MTEKIKMELVEARAFIRYPCNVCGGCTEKNNVLCECAEGDFEGLRICENCLEAGNIDARLEAHAACLEASAAQVRQLLGRIVAPSYEAWLEAEKAANDEVAAYYAAEGYEVATTDKAADDEMAAAEDDEVPF